MDNIEQVLTEEENAQLIIDKFGYYWRATIRNEKFGEIVDATSEDFEGLLEKLNENCGEYLTEMEIPF